jgi:hypothetical protein
MGPKSKLGASQKLPHNDVKRAKGEPSAVKQGTPSARNAVEIDTQQPKFAGPSLPFFRHSLKRLSTFCRFRTPQQAEELSYGFHRRLGLVYDNRRPARRHGRVADHVR